MIIINKCFALARTGQVGSGHIQDNLFSFFFKFCKFIKRLILSACFVVYCTNTAFTWITKLSFEIIEDDLVTCKKM